ncbi:hypothetical protein EZJ49_15190 [Bdellovibrio bacteriovorus]|uniref:hypothetical protein n=1 Tax=Bdellovibrio bacteriovorus TaxID=959 RepID=UPI0021D0F64E|nr:hypothetical protein [Bdellovibrio bacteriovorus]UXR64413.1 hypothetical protein EZJ49_15190 [Bdellovibrio bacteriovorus]
MKKPAIVFFSVLFSAIIVQAAPVVSKTTTEVLGFSNILGTDATSCNYSVENRKDLKGRDEVVVSLTSDKETSITDSIRIPADKLPLKEGVLQVRPGLSITYKKGVLTKKEKLPSEGPSGQDYQVMMVKVSPDLKVVSLGYALDSVKSIFSEKALAEINCTF